MANILPINSEESPKMLMPSTTPYLINYNDEIGTRLKGMLSDKKDKPLSKRREERKLLFDPFEIETTMLGKSMWTVFTGLPQVSAKVARERAARLQELLHFCSSSPEITNAGKNFSGF